MYKKKTSKHNPDEQNRAKVLNKKNTAVNFSKISKLKRKKNTMCDVQSKASTSTILAQMLAYLLTHLLHGAEFFLRN